MKNAQSAVLNLLYSKNEPKTEAILAGNMRKEGITGNLTPILRDLEELELIDRDQKGGVPYFFLNERTKQEIQTLDEEEKKDLYSYFKEKNQQENEEEENGQWLTKKELKASIAANESIAKANESVIKTNEATARNFRSQTRLFWITLVVAIAGASAPLIYYTNDRSKIELIKENQSQRVWLVAMQHQIDSLMKLKADDPRRPH